MEAVKQKKDFTNGKILKKLILFAIPMALATLLQMLFNAADMNQAASDFSGLFGLSGLPVMTKETLYYLRSYGLLFLVGSFGATPVLKNRLTKWQDNRLVAILDPVAMLALLLLCTAYLVDGSFNPFLYFRF